VGFYWLAYDTSFVPYGSTARIYNDGLMNNRLVGVLAGMAVGAAGVPLMLTGRCRV
jgi:hypothetical protein